MAERVIALIHAPYACARKNRIGSKGQLVTPDGGQKFTILYIKIKQKKRKELKKEAEYYRLEFKSVAMIQKCISHTECTCLADLYM